MLPALQGPRTIVISVSTDQPDKLWKLLKCLPILGKEACKALHGYKIF